MAIEPPNGPADPSSDEQRLSYKFQRLRERIRIAIASGELTGKLPGERELAKRFKVNTKTLSKALTELAADGLVERNIGLGTFVCGDSPREAVRTLLIYADDRVLELLALIDPAIARITLHHTSNELTTAAISRFDCVIVATGHLTEEAIRDLVVRGKRVITVGARPATFATRAVLLDEPGAAAELAQRLARRGHRKLMIIGCDPTGETIAAATAAVGPDVQITLGEKPAINPALAAGVTGLIVTQRFKPNDIIQECAASGAYSPQHYSLTAIGWGETKPPCSGLFVQASECAIALTHLLEHSATSRPITVWLNGTFIDAGTLTPPPHRADGTPFHQADFHAGGEV